MTTHTRPPVERDKDRCFKPVQKARMFERAKGRCEVIVDEEGIPIPARVVIPSTARRCNRKIRGKWIAGHYPIPWTLGGKTDINNGRVECPECAKHTHADDTTTAAKVERIAGRRGQKARRQKRGPTLKSNSKLQGRGFDKTKTRGFDGKVRNRNE